MKSTETVQLEKLEKFIDMLQNVTGPIFTDYKSLAFICAPDVDLPFLKYFYSTLSKQQQAELDEFNQKNVMTLRPNEGVPATQAVRDGILKVYFSCKHLAKDLLKMDGLKFTPKNFDIAMPKVFLQLNDLCEDKNQKYPEAKARANSLRNTIYELTNLFIKFPRIAALLVEQKKTIEKFATLYAKFCEQSEQPQELKIIKPISLRAQRLQPTRIFTPEEIHQETMARRSRDSNTTTTRTAAVTSDAPTPLISQFGAKLKFAKVRKEQRDSAAEITSTVLR